MIEEQAVNIDEISAFSPISLNTIRIVTCIDRKGCVNIISTALRVGNGHSHTDNICTGGLAAMINPNTGKIETDAIDHLGKFYEKHPTAGIPLKGYQIPNWNECIATAKSLALEEPEARYVGWDVVLTTKGIDVLEGNIPPDEGLAQVDLKGRWHKIMKMF